MHYHNSTDKQTFLLFIILFWIIGKNLHLVHCQLQNFVFTFFFGWLCHFQRWVFSGKLWLKRSFIPSTFSLTSASAAKMWKQASGGGLSLSWLQRFNFELNQLLSCFFIYFLILFFKIFHHWLWSPNLAAFQFLGTSFPSSPQSQLQPHCLLHLQFWKLCNIPSCSAQKYFLDFFT